MELKLDFFFFLSLLQNLLEEMHKAVYLSVCENWQGKQANRLPPWLLQSESPEDCTHFFHPVSFEIKHSYYTDNLHWISENSEQAPIQLI